MDGEVCASPSRTRYNNGCRCEACTTANREYAQRRRGGKARRAALHGSRQKYASGCRCVDCVMVNRANGRESMRKHRDGLTGIDVIDAYCTVCDEWFSTDAALIAHEAAIHTR